MGCSMLCTIQAPHKPHNKLQRGRVTFPSPTSSRRNGENMTDYDGARQTYHRVPVHQLNKHRFHTSICSKRFYLQNNKLSSHTHWASSKQQIEFTHIEHLQNNRMSSHTHWKQKKTQWNHTTEVAWRFRVAAAIWKFGPDPKRNSSTMINQ